MSCVLRTSLRRFSTGAPASREVEETMMSLGKSLTPNQLQPTIVPKKIVILPPTTALAERYKEDLLSGGDFSERFNKLHITEKSKLQPVYSTAHTYVHTFQITELSHLDFLKKIGLVERQLTKKFGSTFNMRVKRMLPRYHKRISVLRSPFVHEDSREHYKYLSNTYEISLSYAFNLTDATLNDYVYGLMKKIVLAAGGIKKFGYSIKKQPMQEVPIKKFFTDSPASA